MHRGMERTDKSSLKLIFNYCGGLTFSFMVKHGGLEEYKTQTKLNIGEMGYKMQSLQEKNRNVLGAL